MNIASPPLLISAYISPEHSINFTLAEWDLFVRQARRAGVLARFAHFLEQRTILDKVPFPALKHIQSAKVNANQIAISLTWEVICIQKAFERLEIPLVFLKGTAYAAAQDEASIGRVFSDVDILVPEDKLSDVENALIYEGWKSESFDVYEQRYYRKWMHEIPPMLHVQRHSAIDVHHNILPKTCSLCPDANKLLANIIQVADQNAWVLAPEDRVIHSATHLFHEGEFSQGFRDLSDLDLLLKEFSTQEGFWERVIESATVLNQQIPLYYALRYTTSILQTPVPEKVLGVSEQWRSNKIKIRLMDFLFYRALMPQHSSCEDRWTGVALWLLYVRSHWLRMPLYLLLPHLLRKSWLRLTEKPAD